MSAYLVSESRVIDAPAQQLFDIVADPAMHARIDGSGSVRALRSGGPHNKTVLIDIATNWLVYGFPAMAAASAVVLVVAGVRMLARR